MRRSCPFPSRCRICPRSAASPGSAATSRGLRAPDRPVSRCRFQCSLALLRGSCRVQACGCASSGCWFAAGSAIGVPPWPSPAGTKLDAMNWLEQRGARGAAARRQRPGSGCCRPVRRRGCPARHRRSARRRRRRRCSVSLPALPIRTSSPSPPLAVSCIAVPQPRRLDDVVAAEAVDDDAVVGLEAGDRHRRRRDPTP